jgi:hypothetical protein
MPHVHLRPIEPLIAIILARLCGSAPLSLPSLGVSSLDLGRLWQRRRPFFLCTPIVFRVLWGKEQSAGKPRDRAPSVYFEFSFFVFCFNYAAQMLD